MAGSKIPRKLGEITPQWLTETLRDRGVLRKARVTGIEREPMGEGEGFIGQLERLRLRYDVPESGAPATLIAKLPTLVGRNRIVAEMLGTYEREILFYQELAADLPCRVPRVYYAEMDVNPLARHSPKILAWIDRRPAWFMAFVMLLTMFALLVSRRRYALLMEDLAPAEIGDQVAGASIERCRASLQELASLQAALWQSPQLDAHHWLMRQDVAVRLVGLMYSRMRPTFSNRFLGRHPELGPYLDWLDQNAGELTRRFHGDSPHTLLHMDFRLDNLCFGNREDQIVAIFDWQVVARGPGIYDVAYFIAGSLAANVGRDAERGLIVAYHDALVAGGISDYPLERCLFDYECAMLLILHRMASADIMEFGEGRGAILIDRWIERLSARVARVELGNVLEPTHSTPPPGQGSLVRSAGTATGG